MSVVFPSAEWLDLLQEKLNNDAHYGEVARNWEGDLVISIEPEGDHKEKINIYLDLWHGKCRKVAYGVNLEDYPKVAFILQARYSDIVAILTGKLNPMTAMMTSKLKVQGSMGYMMRNVPTVLDFVRCAQEVTTEIL
ncbi:MAG: SCP2 sterol-binding domain-containing protein [Anaerolineae bacterium]